MLLHTDMLQDFRLCQGSLFPKVVRSLIRGLVGSSCCASSSANSHPPDGNMGTAEGQSSTCPKDCNSFWGAEFLLHKGREHLLPWFTAEGCKLSWAAKKEFILLCFVKETADYVGNLCSRSALTSLIELDHTRLGRDPLFFFLFTFQRKPSW